ncbi:MAG: pseudouridine synthase [Candidatus Dormibacteraeota bacterium]|nr:pseudouridine synthase [Candidatus Dormibacteraeota bacterium]
MASRRDADRLIASGSVRVNGRVPPPDGMLVDAETDRVTVDERRVEATTGGRWLAFNKPLGVITTARDPEGRSTVLELVPPEHRVGRLFPVGRLDADTTGLLLLTDDGDLANRLAHPAHKVPKEYVAAVRGVPGERDLRLLRDGVQLVDGRTAPAEAELVSARGRVGQVRIVIREGRNRQVRRMLEAIGHPAQALTRTAVGPIRLGRLRTGGWRRLRPAEIESLRQASGLAGR